MRTARVRAVAFAMAAAVLAALAWAALTGRWPGGSGRSAEARAIARASAVLPGRAVWGHLVPHGLPEHSRVAGGDGYGATYPLDLVAGGSEARPREGAGVPRAQAAGLTGMQILQFEGVNAGSDFVTTWLDQADPTWSDDEAANDFSVAPCLLLRTPQGLARMAGEYVAAVRDRPAAARIGGRYVVFVYGSASLSAAQWAEAKAGLDASGLPVFLIGDLQTDASQTGFTVDQARLDGYSGLFDAVWNFEDSGARIRAGLWQYLAGRQLAFAGGTMPGYDRQTSADGGFVDPRGTALFRQEWQAALDSGAPWNVILTWNDMVEHTDITASSDWNVTRSDINAFYSARLRGLDPPDPGPQLYVTVPSYVRSGEPVRAEALVLNGGKAQVGVDVQLIDAAGRPVGAGAGAVVPGHEAGDATTGDVVTAGDAPAGAAGTAVGGGFVRARATTIAADGTILQQVTSAPTVIQPAGRPGRTPMQRTGYYSVPARAALPGQVSLRIDGDPAAPQSREAGGARATVTAPAGAAVRFAEILQNTRQAGLGFDVPGFTAGVPMRPRRIIGGQRISADAAGCYVGRVIDAGERVGYSDPVLVADPPG